MPDFTSVSSHTFESSENVALNCCKSGVIKKFLYQWGTISGVVLKRIIKVDECRKADITNKGDCSLYGLLVLPHNLSYRSLKHSLLERNS